MRKIKLFVIAAVILTITLTAVCGEEVRAYDQCSGTYKTYTSEMKKPIKIKESKLTSLRYLKRICQITATYKFEDVTLYELDGGNGVLGISRDNRLKECVLAKDGKLYGRIFCKTDNGITVTYNLHNKECSIKGVKATEEQISQLTLDASEVLNCLATELMLDKITY